MRDHTELGGRLGVRGTPTLFINGRRMAGFAAAVLPAILEQEIRTARKGTVAARDIPVAGER